MERQIRIIRSSVSLSVWWQDRRGWVTCLVVNIFLSTYFKALSPEPAYTKMNFFAVSRSCNFRSKHLVNSYNIRRFLGSTVMVLRRWRSSPKQHTLIRTSFWSWVKTSIGELTWIQFNVTLVCFCSAMRFWLIHFWNRTCIQLSIRNQYRTVGFDCFT